MPNARRDNQESLTERPRCPRCRTRMITAGLLQEPEGFERRTLECLKCGHSELKILILGAIKPLALAWSNDAPRPLKP